MKTSLECSDWLHIASGCGTGVYYELRKSQDHPSTFTHKNHDFGGAGGRLHLPSPPAPILTFQLQNPDFGLETHLECSDWLHIASECGTGVYYRLRKSQEHPSTFTHKNHDFGGKPIRAL